MLTTPPAHNATAQQTGRPRSSSTVQKGSGRTTSLEEHGRSRAVSPQQPWSRPRAVSGVQAVHEGHAASKIFVRLFTEDNSKHDFLPKNAAGLVERIVVQVKEERERFVSAGARARETGGRKRVRVRVWCEKKGLARGMNYIHL
eukprot:6202428-Pleurochrysis_carterae.AAC.1